MASTARGSVFITGAAAGIGAATTRLLADAGYRVFAGVHRDPGSLAAAVDGVQPVAIDVTDPASVAEAAREVDQAVGADGLAAVINNAGVIVQGPLELLPADQLRLQFEVNTLGPALTIQAFLPLLRRGQGRIINISAPTARVPVPFSLIGATKAALASVSDSLRLELGAWDIPVTVIEPGGTDTAIFQKAERTAQTVLGAADPAAVALYSDQLAAVAKAGARQSLGPVDPVAKTIVAAVQARKPKRRYTAGSGHLLFGLLARLPAGLRERLMKSALGLG
jgi:NAD(P)-dependent dehydrogenase (short-subunit alcohol dehydrogenase family)